MRIFKNKLNYKYLSLILLVGLLLTLSYYTLNSTAYGDKKSVLEEINSNKENKAVLSDNGALSVALAVQKAIRNVASSVSPSVVNIRTEQIIKRSNRNNSFKRFHNDPFFDFFKDFDDDLYKGPQKQQSLGSGFVISDDGYILTNNHVVRNASKIKVIFSNEKEYDGEIVGIDAKTDVAVIKIKPEHTIKAIPLGNSDDVKTGDFAIAIGNPFGLRGTFTLGVISARGRDNVDQDAGLKNYIQTDASINQGNSGGPLLNIQGQAIGMNTAIFSTTGGSVGIGFAIPINIVKRVVADLIESGKVNRAYLGVTISPIPEDVAKYLELNKKEGIFVQDVASNSPADNAGIKPGDVILQVDQKQMKSVSQLQRAIGGKKNGEQAKLKIFRNGKNLDINVTLGEYSDTKVTKSTEEDSESTQSQGPNKEFLGLVIGTIKDNYQFYKIDKNMDGLLIVKVEQDSPADKAGLRNGDIIQEINYVAINSLDSFEKFINENPKKDSYLFKIKRRIGSGATSQFRNQFVVVENK